MSAKRRYWYSLTAGPNGWYVRGGWCFGESHEAAAADAVRSAGKWNPFPCPEGRRVHLQSQDDAPAEYFTIDC